MAATRIGKCPLLVFAICCLSGCGTSVREYVTNGFKVGPNYHRTSAQVSQKWLDQQDPRLDTKRVTDSAWWTVFNDPRLNVLIQRAYEQNLTLREAGFRVMEARAQRDIAVGNWWPQQQQAFGAYDRNQISLETNTPAVVPRNTSLWTFGTQLAWELDFWGRFRRLIESANAALDASVENYDDALVILLGDTARTYVEIRTLEDRLRYAHRNAESQRGSLDIAETKRGGGAASQLDVAQAQTNLAQTEAIIPQLEIQLRQAQNRLCILLGMAPQDISKLLDGESRIPQPPAQIAIGIPADLVRRRPDVRRAEREVAAQSALIGVAEADMYPAFTISGNIRVEANQFKDLFGSSAVAGNVGPSFNWNILNYGRLRNAVVVEEARYMQEVTQYQNTVLNANREAEDAIIAFLRSQERARVLRIGTSAAEESRNLVSELYRGGRADFGRVFVAELFLAQQQDAFAQAEGDISLALVSVYQALGGGWQIRCQNPAQMAARSEIIPPGRQVAPPIPVPAAPGQIPGAPVQPAPGGAVPSLDITPPQGPMPPAPDSGSSRRTSQFPWQANTPVLDSNNVPEQLPAAGPVIPLPLVN